MRKPDPKSEMQEDHKMTGHDHDSEQKTGLDIYDENADLESEEGLAAFDAAQDRIAELENELATLKDQALRALAEAENTRRRAVKEREDASKYAVSAFAKDLLDFADNFNRALKAMPDADDSMSGPVKSIIDGIEAMDKELLSTLQKHGIVKIEPMDEKFDPNFHEVMFEAPMPDKPAGTIIELIEPGYILHGRLLRPARVGVVKDDGQSDGDNGARGSIDTHA